MAGGWTRDGALQDQIDGTVVDAVCAARAGMPTGESEHIARSAATTFPRVAETPFRACAPASAARARATIARWLSR